MKRPDWNPSMPWLAVVAVRTADAIPFVDKDILNKSNHDFV